MWLDGQGEAGRELGRGDTLSPGCNPNEAVIGHFCVIARELVGALMRRCELEPACWREPAIQHPS